MNNIFLKRLAFCISTAFVFSVLFAMSPCEKLDRGAIAINKEGKVFISWRLLITDDNNTTFNIYRDGVKINRAPLALTNYTDSLGTTSSIYTIQTYHDNKTETSSPIHVWEHPYLRIHLNRPIGGCTEPFIAYNLGREESHPQGESYTYTPNDCSVGDVDGDGEYEIIVKWYPTNARDNSFRGYTGKTYLDCYKLNGKQLWRIDLGKNIRSGAHYTQFLVYDLDGDGKTEMVCKTAPGTVDGKGKYVLLNNDDPHADYRSHEGYVGMIQDGPEYLTVFNGETGSEITTIPYYPNRAIIPDWGDNKANRSERYLACVAFLDGIHPSVVMCRGYYTQTYIAAYDFDGENLKQKWAYHSETPDEGLYGEGAHSLSVADVDNDGKDEIIYGSATLDHDGTLLYRTGLRHGDALHVTDLIPDRKGLEVFMPHEKLYGTDLRDAQTGEILFRAHDTHDTGRGLAADIDPNYRGFEFWSTASRNVYTAAEGFKIISRHRPSINFRIYWDGDLYDELLDGTFIEKWNPKQKRCNQLIDFRTLQPVSSCNGSKRTPNLSADILGDWREEVILWDHDTASDLIIFSTTIPTPYRIPTLMHDHTYRMSIVWQNVGYNQPPHLGYYLPDVYGSSLEQ